MFKLQDSYKYISKDFFIVFDNRNIDNKNKKRIVDLNGTRSEAMTTSRNFYKLMFSYKKKGLK